MLNNTNVTHASRVNVISDSLLERSRRDSTLQLTDNSFQGKFILWGDVDSDQFVDSVFKNTGLTLPTSCGEVTQAGPYKAIWANPKRWYLICEEQEESKLAAALLKSGQVHMSVTDGQCCFRVEGKEAVNVLKKGCSLNFNETVFASGQCLQTRLAITKVFLHRLNAESFNIYVERSYSEYIWCWLLDASKRSQD